MLVFVKFNIFFAGCPSLFSLLVYTSRMACIVQMRLIGELGGGGDGSG